MPYDVLSGFDPLHKHYRERCDSNQIRWFLQDPNSLLCRGRKAWRNYLQSQLTAPERIVRSPKRCDRIHAVAAHLNPNLNPPPNRGPVALVNPPPTGPSANTWPTWAWTRNASRPSPTVPPGPPIPATTKPPGAKTAAATWVLVTPK